MIVGAIFQMKQSLDEKASILIVGLTMLLALIACGLGQPSDISSNITPRSSVLFEDADCIRSCWRGLRPGITRLNDSLLGSLGEVQVQHFDDNTLISNTNFGLLFEQEVLKTIEVYGPLDMTLGELIARLGNPEFSRVEHFRERPPASVVGTVEIAYPYLGVYVRSRSVDGVTATLTSDNHVSVCFTDQTLVGYVVISTPGNLDSLLDTVTNSQFPDSQLSQFKSGLEFGCVELVG